MTVANGKKVGIEYTLTFEGEVIDSNVDGDPLQYTHGEQQIIPGLEKALDGMAVGESKKVTVQPEEGYGPVNEEAYLEVEKGRIPEEGLAVGAQLMSKDENGNVLRPVVREINDDTVVLDFNHPLAGKTLNFDVKVVEVE